jgi:hypothetical protein
LYSKQLLQLQVASARDAAASALQGLVADPEQVSRRALDAFLQQLPDVALDYFYARELRDIVNEPASGSQPEVDLGAVLGNVA